ncbi:MAG: polysaccharide deacetylase family protein [Flavobacteriales bacterium]
MKQLLKRALSGGFLLGLSKGNRFIFCYHDVSDPAAPHHSARYSTTPERFKEHVALFTELFTVLPLDALVSEQPLPAGKNYAAITFDDGFRSVLTHAWPELKTARLPCTVFLNSTAVLHNHGWITDLVLAADDPVFVRGLLAATGLGEDDATDPIGAIMDRGRFPPGFAQRPMLRSQGKIYLDRDEVAQLHRDGVAFGDHGRDHCVLSRTEDAILEVEVSAGAGLIADITGAVPRHFALPFGKRDHYDARTLPVLERNGYSHVYDTSMDRLRPEHSAAGATLPRISVMNETVGQLRFLINRTLLRRYDL